MKTAAFLLFFFISTLRSSPNMQTQPTLPKQYSENVLQVAYAVDFESK